MTNNIEFMNMKQVVAKAAELNIPLSEYTLRRAIHDGQLPCRTVGRTYLIYWENVIRWLKCEECSDSDMVLESGENSHLGMRTFSWT